MEIGRTLIKWYLKNARELPWRNTSNPYHIWISEVVLQQTRVEQGLPYFHKFLNNFPDPLSLASANDDFLFHTWQGLGYYSRAKNLRKAAKIIVEKFLNKIPQEEEALLSLPGIGPYTASAIRAFAYNIPDIALDGNALRVGSRLLGIVDPIDLTATKRQIKELLMPEIPKNHSGNFNQGLIELGALICKPTSPQCAVCPLNIHCHAFTHKITHLIPQKKEKRKPVSMFLHFLVIEDGKKIALIKRGEQGIWNHLHEFPSLALDTEINQISELMHWKLLEKVIPTSSLIGSYTLTHKLTHRDIKATFWHFRGSPINIVGQMGIFDVNLTDLGTYPIHRLMEKYLDTYFWNNLS